MGDTVRPRSSDRLPLSRSLKAVVLVVAWAGLTGLLIAVGVGVVHSSSINAFDRHVTSVVVAHRSPALNAAMKTVTWLGSWIALVATGILVLVLAFRRRIPLAAVVLAVVAWAGEAGGVTLAKHVVGRDRPPQDLRLVSAHGWSWPSGHTAVAIVIFTTLALVVVAVAPNPLSRTLAWVLAVLAVVAVAFSRIELGVHWTTDTIASTVFVVAWLVVLLALFASEARPEHVDAAAP
jgi:membrane-associated phospholipid phosphatase